MDEINTKRLDEILANLPELVKDWDADVSVTLEHQPKERNFNSFPITNQGPQKITITITTRAFSDTISREDWERKNVKPCTDGFMKFQVSQ